LLEVLRRNLSREYSRACPTPGSTVDQTNTSFEMCQNSNDFCFENNTFANYSQGWSPAGFAPLRLCVSNPVLARQSWWGDGYRDCIADRAV
jgi:hypothetical protein